MNGRQRIKLELWHPVSRQEQGDPYHGAANTYNKRDIRAIQALSDYAKGLRDTLDPSDVKAALDWIVYRACCFGEDPFLPGQADVQNLVLGKQTVGRAIVKLMNIKAEINHEDYRENGEGLSDRSRSPNSY